MVSKNPIKTLIMNIDPALDFASDLFDPVKVLSYDKVSLPFPKAKTYNNLAEYYSHTFLKKGLEKDNADSGKDQSKPCERNYEWYYSTLGLKDGKNAAYNSNSRKKQNRFKRYGKKPFSTTYIPGPPLRSKKVIHLKSTFKQYWRRKQLLWKKANISLDVISPVNGESASQSLFKKIISQTNLLSASKSNIVSETVKDAVSNNGISCAGEQTKSFIREQSSLEITPDKKSLHLREYCASIINNPVRVSNRPNIETALKSSNKCIENLHCSKYSMVPSIHSTCRIQGNSNRELAKSRQFMISSSRKQKTYYEDRPDIHKSFHGPKELTGRQKTSNFAFEFQRSERMYYRKNYSRPNRILHNDRKYCKTTNLESDDFQNTKTTVSSDSLGNVSRLKGFCVETAGINLQQSCMSYSKSVLSSKENVFDFQKTLKCPDKIGFVNNSLITVKIDPKLVTVNKNSDEICKQTSTKENKLNIPLKGCTCSNKFSFELSNQCSCGFYATALNNIRKFKIPRKKRM